MGAEPKRGEVAVVITCFNQRATIAEAIQSVFSQSRPASEVIVVDDGSTDDSGDVIEATITPSSAAGRVVAALRQPNTGVIGARNAGLARVRSRRVVFLDGDDALEPGYLQATVQAAEQTGASIVYTDMTFVGDEQGRFRSRPWNPWVLRIGPYIPNPCLHVTDRVREVGGYSRAMGDGLEDWELHLALLERGASGCYVAEPLVRYRRTLGTGRDAAPSEVQAGWRSVARRRHPGLYRGPLRLRVPSKSPVMLLAARGTKGVAIHVLSLADRRIGR